MRERDVPYFRPHSEAVEQAFQAYVKRREFGLSFLGELSCEERSATKPDSSWASGRGAPQPWCRKERSDDRSHRRRRCLQLPNIVNSRHQIFGPPEGGPFGFKPKANG